MSVNINQITVDLALIDERLDRLINIDIGGRGVEHLYEASRVKLNRSPVGAAADALANIEPGATVLMTTGSVTRAWISPSIGENDGPAGAAVVARALAISKHAHCILVCEATLAPAIIPIFRAAGLSVLSHEDARRASQDGSLAAVSFETFPTDTESAPTAAKSLLDEHKPALLFSTERVGRSADGNYYSMRGKNYGMGRARIDHIFDEALVRGLPTISVGDGGNEIGMANIAEAVRRHVTHGERIGAITPTDVLVTAACSNWGCSAIVAALALRLADRRLIHRPELEEALLKRGVEIGLINAVANLIDPNADGIDLRTHIAIVQIIQAIVEQHIR
jgi:hypothetical protein